MPRPLRPRLVVAMSAAILAIVLVGFAPTFYLRVLFDAPPIPPYVHVHGVLLTAWFALVAAQTVLIHGGSVMTHRRLGAAGIFVAAAVVASSAIVTSRFVDRVMHTPTVMLSLLSAMIWFDLHTRRRVHWATLAGGVFVVLGIVAGSVVARSGFGLWVLRSLG